MDDSSSAPPGKKKKERKKWEAGAGVSVQGTALLAWTMQVAARGPPAIFQTYYFTRKVLNYAAPPGWYLRCHVAPITAKS